MLIILVKAPARVHYRISGADTGYEKGGGQNSHAGNVLINIHLFITIVVNDYSLNSLQLYACDIRASRCVQLQNFIYHR